MNNNVIADYARRPREYYNIDGVGELATGFMLLAMGGFVLLPKASGWRQWPVFIVFWAALSCILHYGPKAIKEHITYPRTGFVAYPRRERWNALGAGALVAALYVFLMARGRMNYAILMAVACVPAYIYHMAMRIKWKWLVVLALTAGSLWISPAKFVDSVVPTMTLYGVVLFIFGAISFYLYLRHVKLPVEESAHERESD